MFRVLPQLTPQEGENKLPTGKIYPRFWPELFAEIVTDLKIYEEYSMNLALN